MKVTNYFLGLLFLVSLSHGEVSQHDKALFKAIEKCDFRAVQTALQKGASINAIDEVTGDNPAFFSTKKLLKTILETNDECYMTSVPTNRWLQKLTRGAVITSQLIFIIAFWALIDAKISKQSDFLRCILSTATIPGVFLGIGIPEFYVRTYYQNKKLKNISEIVNLLLTSSDLDSSYKHSQIKTDLKGFFARILNVRPSGRFELVRNYELMGKYIDDAYAFVLDDKEKIYCSKEAYLNYVKPTFEKIGLHGD